MVTVRKRMSVEKLCRVGMVVVCALVMAGCSDDNNGLTESRTPLKLSGMFSLFEGSDAHRLDGGESVGLWITSSDDCSLNQADVASNRKFYQSAAGLVSEPRTYWEEYRQLSLYAYYPYDSLAVQSPEAYLFSVKPDQRSEENVKASALMWTKQTVTQNAVQDEAIRLDFRHLMTALKMNVRGTSSQGSFVGSTVRIEGLSSVATVNLKTGAVTAADETTDILSASLEAAAGYEASAMAVLVPQTIAKGTPFIKVITAGNVENECELAENLVLESGTVVTLDIEIKETECLVTVRDISPWDADDSPLIGEAIEALPSYKVLDFYSRFGVQGIVVSLDAGSEGTHGWIVSTDEAELAWLTDETLSLPAFSMYDEGYNLKNVLTLDPTLDKFPAFKWCDDKNGKRTTLADLAENGTDGRWILPISNRIRDLVGTPYLTYTAWASLERLNAAIEAASVPAAQKVKFEVPNWSDYESAVYYWTSAYVAKDSEVHLVRALASATYDYMGGGTGVRVTYANGLLTYKVRAFYHF